MFSQRNNPYCELLSLANICNVIIQADMKRILGLDLGTTSIGWALVNEAENDNEKSEIIRTGVRLVPLTVDEEINFAKGNSITTNADRTLKRGARRSLQRYKMRRDYLKSILLDNDIITADTIIAEDGKQTTFQLWELRSKAATEKIALIDFARVLFAINKKRGYKSNRKANDEADGSAIDGMEVAKELYKRKITPGEYSLALLKEGKKKLPDFYRSDLQEEFDKIWSVQKKYYPELLTDALQKELDGKNAGQTWKICEQPFDIKGIKLKGKKAEIQLEKYQLRSSAVHEQLDLEHLAIVLQEINGQINGASSYLAEISDRSKELYFNDETIGQYLYRQVKNNSHNRLKNQVFYRQDYITEFDKIWETQAQHYPELNNQLRNEIRDVIIFYQRKLKSQKGLIGICEFEGFEKEVTIDGQKKMKIVGPKCAPKSSPIFQEFKIWQLLNNLEFRNKETRERVKIQDIDEDLAIRNELFQELTVHGGRTANQILKIVYPSPNEWELNYKDGIDGNNTVRAIFEGFQKIAEVTGHEINFKDNASKIKSDLRDLFEFLKLDISILNFDEITKTKDYQKLASFNLWHLLYSYEGDDSKSGNELLERLLKEKFGFSAEHVKILAQIAFKSEYGSLSSKAMLKILPFLKEGLKYNEACEKAEYNHSHSITQEENNKRQLKSVLELLPKNSLRNPVVEKILNQLVNVTNAVIREYGKPEEVRIELARELKKSAKERAKATTDIAAATRRHEAIKAQLKELYPFNKGVRITKKDVVKYKLWEELKENGHKTLYTNTYIPLEKLFSKEFDIEHIIPKARVFDDSFSNKTLATRQFNLDKADDTGIDFMISKYGENSKETARYLANVESLFKRNAITKAKYNKLLTPKSKIKDGFIERDLRNSQYIAKKARQMLMGCFRTVTPTTGSVTDRLRADWQLIDTLKELNLPKYERLDMVEIQESKDGRAIKKIKDWTKRNDHRHHAMDAIAIAFCKNSHVQYFNYLNARRDENHKLHGNIIAISKKETVENEKGKRVIKPPIPVAAFRKQAKNHLEQTLISFKAKNKVVTKNKNRTKSKEGQKTQVSLTPRGQLHKETVYGSSMKRVKKLEKVGASFDTDKIKRVAKKNIQEALHKRLSEFDNDPKKAFTGKNSLQKLPVYIDEAKTEMLPEKVEVTHWENQFTIRKAINSDNFKNEKSIEKIVDAGIRRVLLERLKKHSNNAKEAFSNLDKNPIWLNEEKGITIKRATITGVSVASPLHTKKDNQGNEILDKNGESIPADFVSTGNNHHVAIYRDEKGKLQEKVVSFYEAVARSNEGLPIIDKQYNTELGWEFLFTMKQNEMFVFPNETTGFNPAEVDLNDVNNYAKISPNLFRVQKFTMKDYFFRHHLETTVENNKPTLNVAWKRTGLSGLIGISKVRINHLGEIVHVGEY